MKIFNIFESQKLKNVGLKKIGNLLGKCWKLE